MIENENKKLEILEKARTENKCNNDNDNLKLFHGDFRDVCRREVSDDSIDLIFSDPPYNKQDLHLYEQLGIEAIRMLKEGGSLIMYAPHHALPEIFDYLKKSGLKYRWQIVVIHTGWWLIIVTSWVCLLPVGMVRMVGVLWSKVFPLFRKRFGDLL